MEFVLALSFWTCAGIISYAYVIYPLLVAILARIRGNSQTRRKEFRGSVSVILAAYNEETTIQRRLEELTQLLTATRLQTELIVVSDGSTDDTARIARDFHSSLVHVLELPVNLGKAMALTKACSLARNDVVVFADARQTWSAQALKLLLENFTEPSIGAVSGDLIVSSARGPLAGVGLYWKYEKWLRKQESRFHSMVGVTGAICAVRRKLFHPIPQGIILDDVYWPLQVAMQGYRVVHDERACAYDRLPEKTGDEFRRKIRTLSGNFQLVGQLPTALLPWKNPVWLQFISHKLVRLLVPWALLAMLGLALALPGVLYETTFWAQLGFYAFGLMGMWFPTLAKARLVSAATSFLVLNSAAWLAFWIWLLGKTSDSWTKILYRRTPVITGVDHSPVTI
jgi:cellulose synthase/poly-beta-1,6-N-acetylglucosamine synthase-like glycosyltransferase